LEELEAKFFNDSMAYAICSWIYGWNYGTFVIFVIGLLYKERNRGGGGGIKIE
jgi:hypothetical protein